MFNKLKVYNQLLELDDLTPAKRNESLTGVFKRDFVDSSVSFRGKTVEPTPKDGEDTMSILLRHLTTKTENKDESHREYDRDRSIRIHWVKHHISEKTPDKIEVFSTQDRGGIRTYIFDRDESYVVILEPRRDGGSYYLITAYYLKGNNCRKIENKLKRKLSCIY
ncbi:hypothetical protein [Bacteroides heparinolyticus]|nr:hypothetical protein [Bacteroides heparinolyticus]MCI6212924.1 hypothetical protein [Bacteroides heparinolyticus]